MSNDNKLGGLRPPSGGLAQAHPAMQGIRTQPSFANFYSRPVVEGLYYNGKTVTLDGFHFVGCRFDNCRLLVGSTNFELLNCVIDPSTVIQYGPETVKIVHLFNSRNEIIFQNAPSLAPRRNPDGTITINGISP
ncbi:hypothetical protein ACFOHT_19435 [Massilia oculi]|uniref:hypothetical protein n=1 Tax=Massilia oculi TaxID=945844 RepID=UPI0013B44EC4|nr:hypothetical protein [Massilia oculi]